MIAYIKYILITAIILLLLVFMGLLSFTKAHKNAQEIASPVSDYLDIDSKLYFGRVLGPNNINLVWQFRYSYPYAFDEGFDLYFTLWGDLIQPTNPRNLIKRINDPKTTNGMNKLPAVRLENLKTNLQQLNWPKNYIEHAHFVSFDPGCFMPIKYYMNSSESSWIQSFTKEHLAQYGIRHLKITQDEEHIWVNGQQFKIISKLEKNRIVQFIEKGESDLVKHLANEVAAPRSFAMVNTLLEKAKSHYRLYALKDNSYFFGIFLKDEELTEIKSKITFSENHQPFIPN